MGEMLNIGPEDRTLLPLTPVEKIDSGDIDRVGLVFQDQRILDEVCNLACGYCAPSGFPMRIDRQGGANMPEGWRDTVTSLPMVDEKLPRKPELKDFFALGSAVISSVAENADVQILKLSGGEITLYPQLVEYVRDVHENYPAVQILTNGYKLTPEQIDAFADMGNIFFQISLDGTRQETNAARTPNGRITEKVLANIDRIVERGMAMEINCVLTSRNTGSFDTLLDDLKGKGDIVVIPRPVRGDGRKLMDFTPEQLVAFREVVLDRYEEYKDILPPKVYLERLVSMMELGARPNKCYVPFFVQGVDNYGNAETCSCGGNLPMLGNVLDNPEDVFETHQSATNYDPSGDHDDCKYCMTQFEIMNLYAEGAITKEEMLKIPSYRYGGVLDQVDKTAASIKGKSILTIPDTSD